MRVTLGKLQLSLYVLATHSFTGTKLSMVVVQNGTSTFCCMSSIASNISAPTRHTARKLPRRSSLKLTMTTRMRPRKQRRARGISTREVSSSNPSVAFGTNLSWLWTSIHCTRVLSKSTTLILQPWTVKLTTKYVPFSYRRVSCNDSLYFYRMAKRRSRSLHPQMSRKEFYPVLLQPLSIVDDKSKA